MWRGKIGKEFLEGEGRQFQSRARFSQDFLLHFDHIKFPYFDDNYLKLFKKNINNEMRLKSYQSSSFNSFEVSIQYILLLQLFIIS